MNHKKELLRSLWVERLAVQLLLRNLPCENCLGNCSQTAEMLARRLQKVARNLDQPLLDSKKRSGMLKTKPSQNPKLLLQKVFGPPKPRSCFADRSSKSISLRSKMVSCHTALFQARSQPPPCPESKVTSSSPYFSSHTYTFSL